MTSPLDQVCCASVPERSLAFLAEIRCRPDVTVVREDGRAWIHWPAGAELILQRVLALPGVELFEQREGSWRRHGRFLPVLDVPSGGEMQPLCRTIYPAPVQPEPRETGSFNLLKLQLVSEGRPRPASALICPLKSLVSWAGNATSAQLSAIEGIWDGQRAFLIGHPLPVLPGNLRFWGNRVFIPLGFRTEPFLPENSLLEVFRITQREIMMFASAEPEVISTELFQPLSRTMVRLADNVI